MYLKRLDILGFKSFAQKTSIQFSSGVTAIVGPNGCGKTNVLDALRWVLGEQRVSLLRGGKMEEVIFNGSQDLKPLGMSEVTLSVINNRGVLPTEYNEVQVTRRLFRSGESEYLLNKVPCRLKDITELFLDTGMGTHSYSVIQQDMVDAILSDKAEERRFLFEEAAGITKYKQRKKAALRKLDATDQDFLRLKDIHAEVRTQVNSLYRQHKKAERYQHVIDDIRQWELSLSSERVQSLERERRELNAKLEELADQRQGHDTQLSQASAELETSRKEQLDLERQLSKVGAAIYEITEQVHSAEREISVAREKRSNNKALIEKNDQELAAIKEKRDAHKRQKSELDAELQEARQKVEAAAVDVETAQKKLAEDDEELLQVRRAKEEENRRLIDLEGRLSSGRTEESTLKEQEKELASRVGSIDDQIATNSPLQSSLAGELNAHKQKLDELTARKQNLTHRRTEVNTELDESIERTEELSEEISSVTASLEACEARRNLLSEMMANYEGHGAGVVAAMENRSEWPGIVGTVGELFLPVEGMELAVERALGDLAGCIVCRDRATAANIIGWLKRESKGQAGLLIPDPPSINPAVKRPELNHPEFIGWMDERVSVPPELTSLKQAILARVAVYRSGVDPKDVLPHLPFGFAAVTTDGVVYQGNLVVGGSDDSFPIFRRKERIQQQESLIQELTRKMERLRRERSEQTTRQAELRAESSRIVRQLEDLSEEFDEQQKKLQEFDYERRTLVSEFERLDRERDSLKSKLEGIRNRQTSLGLDYGQLADLKTEVVAKMESVNQKVEAFEQASSRAAETVSRTQVALIEARNRVEHLEGRIGHIDELLSELDRTETIRTNESEAARTEIAACEESIDSHEQTLKGLFEQRERTTQRQDSLRGVQGGIIDKVSGHENRIKEARDLRDSLNNEIHSLEMRSNTINGEIGSVRTRLLEEYEVDVVGLQSDRPDAEMDDAAAREHLQTQKEKLKKFGAVNLLALEEYRTASEREKFLSVQLDDLESAKRDLQATISKINVTARRLFEETFEKARENFQSLFVELFSGGEADISLTDPEDPLESPLEITARPRGKKLLSIAQMSGGERALTAISLLFALYLVKPSPFCILDEIDAPLDDANCHRFLKMIRHFTGMTQFVIITHNKITMEAADNLYGITMEMPGVSRLVAVRFNEAGDLIGQPEAEVAAADDPELPEKVRERVTPHISIPVDEESGQ